MKINLYFKGYIAFISALAFPSEFNSYIRLFLVQSFLTATYYKVAVFLYLKKSSILTKVLFTYNAFDKCD